MDILAQAQRSQKMVSHPKCLATFCLMLQDVQVCARFNGGANAGHTLLVDSCLKSAWCCECSFSSMCAEDGKKYAFHLLPCGMINKADHKITTLMISLTDPADSRGMQEPYRQRCGRATWWIRKPMASCFVIESLRHIPTLMKELDALKDWICILLCCVVIFIRATFNRSLMPKPLNECSSQHVQL